VVAKVTVPVVHVTEPSGVPIVRLWAHISVMPLTAAQDTVAPLGAFFINMVSAILLTLAAVETMLALTVPLVEHMLVTLLLCHASNGGIIDEGGTDSTMITPCCSLSVAIVGMVVVTSLVMSPYGMINMATIVCDG
jgi:hypothetical protein